MKGPGPMPHRLLPRAARGLLCWLCGVYAVSIGTVSYVLTEPTPDKERALAWQRLAAQPDVFGWILITLGLCAVVGGYLPHGRDRLPMAILAGWCFVWGASFIWSLIFFGAPLSAAIGPFCTWMLVTGVCLTGLVKLAGSDVVR